jgi:hypothetical protein
MSSVHTWPQFVAKVVTNEISPVYERVFPHDKVREYFYHNQLLTEWTRQLIVLYYDETISKQVFREMLEWHCWRTKIAAGGALKDLKAYNDFCSGTVNFPDCAHEFDSALTEEEAAYVRSL